VLAGIFAELVIDEKLEFEKVYRSNKRSFVGRFDFDGKKLVLKIPRARNARYWERFLSIFRRGECSRVFAGLLKLQELKFVGPIPLLAAERKRFGAVVDGFMVHEYLEGDVAGEADVENILGALLTLHKSGYIRRDPQFVNFLVGHYGVVFIDCRLKRLLLFPQFQCYMELAQFLRECPGKCLELPQRISQSNEFKLASFLDIQKSNARQIRKKIKPLFFL